ncbi:rhomboid family intramembrane serine protease [Anianabacter salinae]|uniref:rhomboid family intramembrane serine protease n=1 Tax=Anianabacter salinae TaxID=2851023 RepID=UPI00225E3118|nr:rhomboid family intramembrane serine protease [Anianabacter salinae]MBV0911374.1 rhomboid family intramembrane serine protease [Anianabacter salinae]
MFPIRDHNPSTQTPWVTYALIATNVVVFLLYLPLMDDPRALQQFFLTWGMVPARIASGDGYHTLVTSLFLHGGFMHLAGNMLFLWIFGDNLEEDLGRAGFLAFYLASGVGADLIQMAAAPLSLIPTVGASGAIAGVMGGYLLLYPRARVDILFILFVFFKIIPVPAWVMLGLWFALQVFSGVGADPDMGGVAYWAHAGGFLIGFLFMIPTFLRKGGTAFWTRTHGHPDHPEAKYKFQRSSVPTIDRRR